MDTSATDQLLNYTTFSTMAVVRTITPLTMTTTTASSRAGGGGRLLGPMCVPGEEHEEVTIPPFLLRMTISWFEVKEISSQDVALKIAFYVLIMLVDIVGNGLVIFLVSASKKMRTPTNVLLVNLALADLLLCLLCMWVHLGNSVTQEWPFGLVICKVNMFAQVTMITSSVLTLTIISLERFFAIVFPLRRGWTLRLTAFIIVMIWIIACSIASPQLHVRYLKEHEFIDRHVIICTELWPQVYSNAQCDTWQPNKMVYHLFVAVVMFLVPIVVMIVCYTVICVCLLVRKAPGSSSTGQSNSKKRVVRMLVVLVVVFVVCWTPTHVLELMPLFYQGRRDVSETVSFTALFIGYLNSALNPVLYAGFNENFRRGFQDIFKRGCFPPIKTGQVRPHDLQSAAPSTVARTKLPMNTITAVTAHPGPRHAPQKSEAGTSNGDSGSSNNKRHLHVITGTNSMDTNCATCS